MRFATMICVAALALSALPAAAQPEAERDPAIVVEGQALQRLEIERILEADNLDTSRLSTRDVLEAMRAIPRGRAPDDFWAAYRAHVRAWERFAAAEARLEALQGGKSGDAAAAIAAMQEADLAIETTFDEVERIARRYGARIPVPATAVEALRTI